MDIKQLQKTYIFFQMETLMMKKAELTEFKILLKNIMKNTWKRIKMEMYI